jgi:hypothetical protein
LTRIAFGNFRRFARRFVEDQANFGWLKKIESADDCWA